MRRPDRIAFAFAAVVVGCAGSMPDTLGPSETGLAPCPASPNCVSTSATSEQHGLEPFLLAKTPAASWPAIEQAVAGLPGTEVVTSDTGYLHAESTSRLMRYVDDLEVWAPADADRLEVRSASRVGYGDMGVNRRRAEALRTALREAGVVR